MQVHPGLETYTVVVLRVDRSPEALLLESRVTIGPGPHKPSGLQKHFACRFAALEGTMRLGHVLERDLAINANG
jgi:hypothetical protein